MSQSILINTGKSIYISADSAVTRITPDGKHIRISNKGIKLGHTGNACYFASGEEKAVYNTLQMLNSGAMLQDTIKDYIIPYNADVTILYCDRQMHSFFYQKGKVEDLGRPSSGEIDYNYAGYITDSSISDIVDNAIRHNIKNISKAYRDIYNKIACTEIGGTVTVYKVTPDNITIADTFIADNINCNDMDGITHLITDNGVFKGQIAVGNEHDYSKIHSDIITSDNRTARQLILDSTNGVKLIGHENGIVIDSGIRSDGTENSTEISKLTVTGTSQFNGDITGNTVLTGNTYLNGSVKVVENGTEYNGVTQSVPIVVGTKIDFKNGIAVNVTQP